MTRPTFLAKLVVVTLGILLVAPLPALAGKLLWWQRSGGYTPTWEVLQSQLDGTGVQRLTALPAGVGAWGLDYDPVEGTLYWFEVDPEQGTSVLRGFGPDGCRDVLTAPQSQRFLVVDPERRKAYWGLGGSGLILGDLDGGGFQTVLSGLTEISGIAFDAASWKIYWSERNRIGRADGDGSNVETVVSGATRFNAVAVDPSGAKVYWLHEETGATQGVLGRADLDGTNVEELITYEVFGVSAITLDPYGGKVYWTDGLALHRADLDGSNPETLNTTDLQFFVYELVIDPLGSGVQPFDCSGSPVPALQPTGAAILLALLLGGSAVAARSSLGGRGRKGAPKQ